MEYNLLNCKLHYSEDLRRYNGIKNDFIKKAKQEKERLTKLFISSSLDYTEVDRVANDILINTIEDYIIPLLIENEIVGIDLSKFIKLHKKNRFSNRNLFILNEEDNALKKARDSSSHYSTFKITLHHMGEKLLSPLKGENTKRVISKLRENTLRATKSIKKVNNNLINYISKHNIINREEHIVRVSTFIFNDILNMHYTVIEILNSILNSDISIYPSSEIREEIKSRLNNIKRYEIDKVLLSKILKQSIEENPYDEELYSIILEKYGDENGELENLANIFNVDLDRCKNDLLEIKFKALDLSTEEKCKNQKLEFIEFSRKINENKIGKYLIEFNRYLSRFDIDFRTVEGKFFYTREEAILAKQDKIRLDIICSRFKELNENELHEIRKDIIDSNFKTNLYKVYLDKIDQRLKLVIETNETEMFEKLIKECNMKDCNSIIDLIEYIEDNKGYYKSKAPNRVLLYLNNKLKECKKF